MPENANSAIRWCVCAAYAALIAYLSLAPSDNFREVSGLFEHQDKAMHFVMYGVLAALAMWTGRIKLRNGEAFVWCVALVTVYGITMEVGQTALTGGDRTFSLWDMMANAAGAGTFAALYGLIEGGWDRGR